MTAKKKPTKKPAAKPKAAKKAAPKPKQPSLPTMENRAIASLESKAEEYLDIKKQRENLGADMQSVLDELGVLMNRYQKKTYSHKGLTIEIEAGKPKIRVKYKTPKGEQVSQNNESGGSEEEFEDEEAEAPEGGEELSESAAAE